MVFNDEQLMRLCLQEAWIYQGLTYPNPAVGACIVQEGRLVSLCAHQQAGMPHAEVLALQQAFAILTGDKEILSLTQSLTQSIDIHHYLHKQISKYPRLFTNTTLYTTLSPCNHSGKTPACSDLIKAMGIKKVVIGIQDPHSKGGVESLQKEEYRGRYRGYASRS